MARQEPQQAQEAIPAMGKKYSAEILVATSEPRSVQELSDEFGIPIATCYRRVEELVEQGLLEQCGTQVSDNNREMKIYKRTVDHISIDFSDSISISTQEKSSTRKIDKIWQKLQTALSN